MYDRNGRWQSDDSGMSSKPGEVKDVLENPQYAKQLDAHRKMQVGRAEMMGHKGEQLPMFMSAGEIMQKYQPLEGDRQSVYDPREGELTQRSRMTGGQPNRPIKTNDRQWIDRMHGQSALRGSDAPTHYRDYGPQETDEQLWSRKLEESMLSGEEYRDVHGGGGGSQRTPGYETLAGRSSAPKVHDWSRVGTGKSIGEDTYDQEQYEQAEYVGQKQEEHRWSRDQGSLYGTLHEAMRPGGEGFTQLIHLGTQFGTSGKPQVVGAHHRIAAMEDIDPNRLLPVVHHKSIAQARQDSAEGGYRYT